MSVQLKLNSLVSTILSFFLSFTASTFSLSSISRSPFKRLDIGFDKKRKRDDDLEDARHPSKIPRSMSMEVKSSDASQSLCRTKSDGILSVKAPPQDLSVAHKKVS